MEDAEQPRPAVLDESFMRQNTDQTLLSIIQGLADVNIADDHLDTPLHWAVKRQSIAVALELIKRGANINAIGKRGFTPLHVAVCNCNIEAVCLLLYYNADATMACPDNKVAFMYAIEPRRSPIAYALLDYHDTFPVSIANRDTVLHIFARNTNRIAIDLVYKGVNVNSINTAGYNAIVYSLSYDTPDLFKLLWVNIHKSTLFLMQVPFLIFYFDYCNFNQENWAECLYLVLECDEAHDLVQDSIEFLAKEQDITFFKVMLSTLYNFDIPSNHKTNIIYMFLTLGADVYFSDIDWLVGKDYIEDARMLVYFSTNDPDTKPNRHVLSEFLTLTCRPISYTYQYIYDRFVKQVRDCADCDCLMNSVERATIFYALPIFFKNELKAIVSSSQKDRIEIVTHQIDSMVEFTSLYALCRNTIRTTLQGNCDSSKPYQFYDALNQLGLPDEIYDVLIFKERPKTLFN